MAKKEKKKYLHCDSSVWWLRSHISTGSWSLGLPAGKDPRGGFCWVWEGGCFWFCVLRQGLTASPLVGVELAAFIEQASCRPAVMPPTLAFASLDGVLN